MTPPASVPSTQRRGRRVAWWLVSLLACARAAWAGVGAYEHTAEQLKQTVQAYRELTAQTRGYDLLFYRDPLRPLVDARGQLLSSAGLRDGLAVQGIIWSDKRPLAIIDDELFGAGDTAGPYTILKVRPDGVVARHNDQVLLIPLDRGLDTPSATSLPTLTLYEDTPVPYAPRRITIVLDSSILTSP